MSVARPPVGTRHTNNCSQTRSFGTPGVFNLAVGRPGLGVSSPRIECEALGRRAIAQMNRLSRTSRAVLPLWDDRVQARSDHAHRPARHEQNPLRTRVAPTRARPPNLADQVGRRAGPGRPLGVRRGVRGPSSPTSTHPAAPVSRDYVVATPTSLRSQRDSCLTASAADWPAGGCWSPS